MTTHIKLLLRLQTVHMVKGFQCPKHRSKIVAQYIHGHGIWGCQEYFAITMEGGGAYPLYQILDNNPFIEMIDDHKRN